MEAANKLIEEKIMKNKVMVFSKSGCGFCSMAIKIFEKLIKDGQLSRDDYEVMDIGSRRDCSALQDALHKKTGGRTVPRVFVNKKCIGGGSETQDLYSNGQLVKRIAAA